MNDRSSFFNPRGRYYGKFTPENLMFNANLQEFAHRVSIICNLETGGKLTPEESFEQIQALWIQLKQSKQELRIGQP
jgi:hypothetical protein